MKPVNFVGANAALKQPADWDEEKNGECEDLAVSIDREARTITSIWKPSPEELAALNAGGGVALTVFGEYHPPISIWTVNLTTPQEEDEAEQEDVTTEMVEDPHPEVVEKKNSATALTPEEEFETITDIIARNNAKHG